MQMIEQPFTFRLCSSRPRVTSENPQPKKVPKYLRWNLTARNNPQPRNVKHFYGLHNMPICQVVDPPKIKKINDINEGDDKDDHDPIFRPHNTLNGLSIIRLRHIPIREKMLPLIGFIPVHEIWRRELRALTESIMSQISGDEHIEHKSREMEYHPYPICRPITAIMKENRLKQEQNYLCEIQRPRTCVPKFPPVKIFPPDRVLWDKNQTGDYESQVFALLGQIFQTNNVEFVKKWLTVANDREKANVMDLLQSALKYKLEKEDNKYVENDYLKSKYCDFQPTKTGHVVTPESMELASERSTISDHPPRTRSSIKRLITPCSDEHPASRGESSSRCQNRLTLTPMV